MIFLEIIVFSSLVYVAEHGSGSFTSIPATSWWAFTTITTVGYGDMYPVSFIGRVIGVLCMFSGLLLIALPVIIIGANFQKQYAKYVALKNSYSKKQHSPQILGIARVLDYVNKLLKRDVFDWEDVSHLENNGIDSYSKLNRILKLNNGFVYLPNEFESYKKMLLIHFYAEKLKKRHTLNYVMTNDNDTNYYMNKMNTYRSRKRLQSNKFNLRLSQHNLLFSGVNMDDDDIKKAIETNNKIKKIKTKKDNKTQSLGLHRKVESNSFISDGEGRKKNL